MARPNGFTHHDIPKPEFVIVGAHNPNGEGVVLLASRHVTYARLQELAHDTIRLQDMTAGWMKTGIFLSLSVGIDDFLLVGAATYAEAFSILFGQWQPKQGTDVRAIDAQLAQLEAHLAARRAIEAAPNEGPDF